MVAVRVAKLYSPCSLAVSTTYTGSFPMRHLTVCLLFSSAAGSKLSLGLAFMSPPRANCGLRMPHTTPFIVMSFPLSVVSNRQMAVSVSGIANTVMFIFPLPSAVSVSVYDRFPAWQRASQRAISAKGLSFPPMFATNRTLRGIFPL